MRLSDYLIRPISTSTEPSGQYELQLEAYNLAVNLINGITRFDIEQIKANSFYEGYRKATEQANDCIEKMRAEIEDLDNPEYEFEGYYSGVTDALAVIDKYTLEDRK